MSEERGVRSRKWYETIERPEMQAMSESHRAWQQQLQQAEMQAQAAAEAQAVVSDANRNSPDVAWEAQAQRADEPGTEAALIAWERIRQMSDPPQSEPTPDTSAGAVQQRIDQVCNDLVAGRTTPVQRRGLTGAVERAGRVPSGSDAAVGRIARLPR